MTRLDWIAVGPRGVYRIMDAGLAGLAEGEAFKADIERRGHKVELVTVEEAVRRHREFLGRGPSLAFDLPSFLPSPAQLDLFGARP